jgi:co-chaperonin GroES (HSP10)
MANVSAAAKARHWAATSGFIVIKRDRKASATKSGILLPGTLREDQIERGTVIAYGPHAENVKCDDVAFYSTQHAHKIDDDHVSVGCQGVVALQRDAA